MQWSRIARAWIGIGCACGCWLNAGRADRTGAGSAGSRGNQGCQREGAGVRADRSGQEGRPALLDRRADRARPRQRHPDRVQALLRSQRSEGRIHLCRAPARSSPASSNCCKRQAQQFRHRLERVVGLVQGPAQARRDHEIRIAGICRLYAVRQARHVAEGLLGRRRLCLRASLQHPGDRFADQGFPSDQLE